jgi:hypothetical protein
VKQTEGEMAMPNNTDGVNAAVSANLAQDRNQRQTGLYASSARRRSPAAPEEARNIDAGKVKAGRREFSPAAIVDISKNAQKLWQESVARRGHPLTIAKPYFSSRLLEKMRKAGQLGPGGLASLAYKRMVDIFV